jgi:hypothetical protein
MVALQTAIKDKQYLPGGYLSVHGSLRLRWREFPRSPAYKNYNLMMLFKTSDLYRYAHKKKSQEQNSSDKLAYLVY